MKKLLAFLITFSSLAFGQLVIGSGGQVTLGVGTITGLSDGNTVSGSLVSGVPPSASGQNGDYFLDQSLCIWGPKASNAWPGAYITCGGSGGGGATLPFPGPVCATSASGGTVCTSSQIQSAIGTGVYQAAGSYQAPISLTTTGTNCATSTFAANVLNIPACTPTSGGLTSFTTGNLSPLFTVGLGGSPTMSPALAFTLSNAAQNSVLAGPSTGGSGAPSYRTLVSADIPSLAYLPSSTQIAQTLSSATHQWIKSYTASTGTFTQTQPASTDLSDYPIGGFAAATAIPAAQVAANLASSGSTGVTGTLPASQVGSGYPYSSLASPPTIPTLSSLGLTNATTQGNTFNGASQLVQMTSGAKLPAVDGSLLTNLPSGGGVTLTGTYSASYPMYYATSATTMAPDLTFNYNYSTGLHTFSQDVAFVSNLNPSYSATFHIPYLGANRTYTYPDATGNVVLDSATQTLTNKTVDGVTPTVFGYLDPTSSVQTQLNSKASAPANALVTTTCPGSSLTMNTSTVVQASSACTITLPSGSTGSWASITAGKGYSAVTVNPPSGTMLLNGVSVSSVTIQAEDNAGFFWAGSQYIVSAHTMNPAFTTATVGTTNPVTIGGSCPSPTGKVANADGTGCSALPTVPSNITTQGNTFNGASQLVQTTAAGKLPAVDGSLLTNVPGVSLGTTSSTAATGWTAPCNVKALNIPSDGVTDIATSMAAAQTACPQGLFFPQGSGAYYTATGVIFTVPVWMWGGQFSGSGALTFNGGLYAGYGQIFTGTNIVTFGAAVPVDYAEWWGALGNNAHDDTTALNTALNAFSAGGTTQLLAKQYLTSSAVATSKNSVGLLGVQESYFDTPTVGSWINNNSATSSIVSLTGQRDFARHVVANRTVAGSAGAEGWDVETGYETTLEHVWSLNNPEGIYIGNSAANVWVLDPWIVYTSISSNSVTQHGINIDNSSTATQSTKIEGAQVANNSSSSLHVWAYYVHGGTIEDIKFYQPESAGTDWLLYVTGNGSSPSKDIFVTNPVCDNALVGCVYISGVSAGDNENAINISGGMFSESSVSGEKLVDIESSKGISVTDTQFYNDTSGSPSVGIYANSSTSIGLAGNTYLNIGYPVWFNSTNNSSIVGRVYDAVSAYPGNTAIKLVGSSYNSIIGGVISGYWTNSITLDASSNNNKLPGIVEVCTNITTCAPTNSGTGNTFDGTSGSGGLSGMTAGYIPQAATSTTVTGNSPLDCGITTTGVCTSSQPLATNTGGFGTVSTSHFIGNSATPAIAFGAAVGTPTATSINGTDFSGDVGFTTGTAGSAGTVATITFANAYTFAPHCSVLQNGGSGLAVGWGTSTTTLTITNSTAASSSTAYKLTYICGQ